MRVHTHATSFCARFPWKEFLLYHCTQSQLQALKLFAEPQYNNSIRAFVCLRIQHATINTASEFVVQVFLFWLARCTHYLHVVYSLTADAADPFFLKP